jgi:hypothetical protein
VPLVTRHCARPDCNEQAAATLTVEYAAHTAWLDHLADDPHPAAYDLCSNHGDLLTVPRGWTLDDRRREQVLFEVGSGIDADNDAQPLAS